MKQKACHLKYFLNISKVSGNSILSGKSINFSSGNCLLGDLEAFRTFVLLNKGANASLYSLLVRIVQADCKGVGGCADTVFSLISGY